MKATSTRIINDNNSTRRYGWAFTRICLLVVIAVFFYHTLDILRILTSNFDSTSCNNANDRVAVETLLPSGPVNSISSEKNDRLFLEIWPEIKGRICPNGVPSHEKYGAILMKLARQELGLQNKDPNFYPKRHKQFWTHWPQRGVAFVSNSTGSNSLPSSFLHSPIWKCANDDIRKNLVKHIPNAKEVSIYCSGRFECWLDVIGGVENIQHACIVAVVRDPISHFLSAYNEYEVRLNAKSTLKDRSKANMLAHPLNFERFAFGEEKRFEQFIVDFLTAPNELFGEHEIHHVYSMTGILAGLNRKYQRQLDGYLPSLHDLEKKYPAFLKETCPHVLPESAFEPWNEDERYHHPSEADNAGFRAAANSVWKKRGPESRALCVLRAMDYACYDKLPVDKFCEEVYMSQSFSNFTAL